MPQPSTNTANRYRRCSHTRVYLHRVGIISRPGSPGAITPAGRHRDDREPEVEDHSLSQLDRRHWRRAAGRAGMGEASRRVGVGTPDAPAAYSIYGEPRTSSVSVGRREGRSREQEESKVNGENHWKARKR